MAASFMTRNNGAVGMIKLKQCLAVGEAPGVNPACGSSCEPDCYSSSAGNEGVITIRQTNGSLTGLAPPAAPVPAPW